MSYDALAASVVAWTNKPLLVTETQLAIRQAVRAAHNAGNFHRDIATYDFPGFDLYAPISDLGLQEIEYTTYCLRLRQLAYVKDLDLDKTMTGTPVLDLRDPDGFYKLDTCYAMGNKLFIRPAQQITNLQFAWYQRPDPDQFAPGEEITDWLTIAHEDLIVLWAAASVLAMIGEQEIKTRVEALAKVEREDLISNNLEVTGR